MRQFKGNQKQGGFYQIVNLAFFLWK